MEQRVLLLPRIRINSDKLYQTVDLYFRKGRLTNEYIAYRGGRFCRGAPC